MSDIYIGGDNLAILAKAERYNNYLQQEICKFSNGAARVLDFGAGIGTFADALLQQGIQVVCVEPDLQFRASLAERNFEVFSNISEIPYESIDYIYSLNVLEHIEDDTAALRELFMCLKPGGRLFLYVPAFPSIFSSMDRKVGHYRRYRKSEMILKCNEVGYEIEEVRYVDCLGYLASVIYKIFGSKKGDLDLGSVKNYDTFLFPLSRLLDHILDSLVGKNLCVVVQKPIL